MGDFPDYDKHYTLLRQWSSAITREEAHNILNAALGDEVLYRCEVEPDDPWSVRRHIDHDADLGFHIIRTWPKENIRMIEPTYDEPGTCIKCGGVGFLRWLISRTRHEASHLSAVCAACGFWWKVKDDE